MARFDFRIDDELLERVRKIALDVFNAPVHHRSGKPEVTDTLNKLIELGVSQIESGNYQDTGRVSLPDNYTDTITDKVVERIEGQMAGKVARLESEVERLTLAVESVLNTDNNTDIAAIQATIAKLIPRLEKACEILEIDDDGNTPDDFDDDEDDRPAGLTAATVAPIFGDDEATAPAYISQAAVAKEIGVDPSTVSRWVKEKRKPTQAEKIAAYDRLFSGYRHDGKGFLKNN